MLGQFRNARSRSGGWRGKAAADLRTRNVVAAGAALVGLSLVGLADAATAANPLKHRYMVMMSGANQVPPSATSGSGTAKVVVDGRTMTVCVKIKVTNLPLPATAAHIHQAPAGANGPIVLQFTPPAGKKPTSMTGSSHSCATQVSPSLISGLLNNPADYYVNVHTTNFPSGAIRGQLA